MKNRNVLIIMMIISIILLIFMTTALMKGLNLTEKNGIDVIVDSVVNSDDISKEDKEIIEKYSASMENVYTKALTVQKKKNLTLIIDEIIDNLNKREYSKLYSKLETVYAESQFPTEKDFEEFIDETLLDGTDYVCKFFDAKYYGYECAIFSELKDISFRLKINPKEDFEDYTLTFRTDIVSTAKRNQAFGLANLNWEILYEFNCVNTLEFVVSIKNPTNNTINFSLEETNVESNYRGTAFKYNLLTPFDEIILKPKEEKNITLIFDIKDTKTPRPVYMNVICKVGQKEYTNKVSIDSLENY